MSEQHGDCGPEDFGAEDWCDECGTPIGIGDCGGCHAVAAIDSLETEIEGED